VIGEALVMALISVISGAVSALLVRPVLRRLPEPAPPEPAPPEPAPPEPAPPEPADSAGKHLYRNLGSARFVICCGVLAGLAAAISWRSLPHYVQPMWSVLAILGVLLAAIDARTSWLPLRLTRIAWLAMAIAGLLSALLGGVLVAGRAAAGAAIAGALYLFVWLISRGGFGFGDVRFAPLLGAAAAADSWTLLWGTLLLGTVVGGFVGLLRLARGRREAFAYAPSMLTGAYAACLLTLLT
jgi:leader peptidase (prepilin peptidase)/N-methyltransferase